MSRLHLVGFAHAPCFKRTAGNHDLGFAISQESQTLIPCTYGDMFNWGSGGRRNTISVAHLITHPCADVDIGSVEFRPVVWVFLALRGSIATGNGNFASLPRLQRAAGLQNNDREEAGTVSPRFPSQPPAVPLHMCAYTVITVIPVITITRGWEVEAGSQKPKRSNHHIAKLKPLKLIPT